jgi:hypothetical protein
MKPKEAEVPARLSKKFVRGRYAVLRRDTLTEGESCVVMLGTSVSVFHNVINNLHKIRNKFVTVRNVFKHSLSRKEKLVCCE